MHDNESIVHMRAACELAARVLDYAGTLVKVSMHFSISTMFIYFVANKSTSLCLSFIFLSEIDVFVLFIRHHDPISFFIHVHSVIIIS